MPIRKPILVAHWSVCQKLNRVSAVQFSYVALYAPLATAGHTVIKTINFFKISDVTAFLC